MSQSFRALGVSAEVEQALAARGIAEPFRIQSLVVPDALAGRDILGKAPTGSGKTLAFGAADRRARLDRRAGPRRARARARPASLRSR